MRVPFNTLQGLTLVKITVDGDEVKLLTDTGRQFSLHHDQDCCESVELNDVDGDWNDLLDRPLVLAEEVTSSEAELLTLIGAVPIPDSRDNSFTWTFYRLATTQGMVVMRWFGTSNGYYSEDVDLHEITKH